MKICIHWIPPQVVMKNMYNILFWTSPLCLWTQKPNLLMIVWGGLVDVQ